MIRISHAGLFSIACIFLPACLLAQSNQQPPIEISGNENPTGEATQAPPALRPSIPAVTTTTLVNGDETTLQESPAPATRITQDQILSAAGTYGDFTRYLQVLPGVVWKSDLTNDLLVRGGHPTENLFVVDGVEIPNISHFSLSGSNGGFTSMLDSTAVGSVDMRSGIYDAGYSSRLSSLIEIHTYRPQEKRQSGNLSLGIAGAGGLYQRLLAGNRTLLLSAHRSVMNLVTNDIGINGVPVYANALARIELNPGNRDSISVFTLGGADSIDMRPCPTTGATSSFQTQYSGWRSTEALSWRHTYASQLVANLTASSSYTRQKIGQQQQISGDFDTGVCENLVVVPVYTEDSRNAVSMLNYKLHAGLHGWLFSLGAGGLLATPDDSVAQPIGQLSPYSPDPARSDADSFHRRFSTGQSSAFAQAQGAIGARLRLLAGLRVESFALTGGFTLDPRISAIFQVSRRQSLHASWNQSSQLPPIMDMLSYPGNRALLPIQVRQQVFGLRIWQGNWGTLDAEAYQKDYSHEPVSTEYPALMLSNMVDTLGQGFAWLPLVSAGTAQSRGLELALRAHWPRAAQLSLSAARSETTYRALDGIRRPGNYDIPFVANAMGSFQLPWQARLDMRESFASGRPFCPFDLADSNAQMRGIYDLSRINALRGPLYNRLDLELERNFRLPRGLLEVHLGAENVFNRGNLEGYVWMTHCPAGWGCNIDGDPITRVDQMGRYPVLALRYQF